MSTVTVQTELYSTANTTSYTSPSFTPAAGETLFVSILEGNSTGGSSPSLSNSDGLTFTEVTTNTNTSGVGRMKLYVSNSYTANVSQTVTFSVSTSTVGCIMFVWTVSGTNTGSSAIFQSKVATGTSTGTPTATFDSAPSGTRALLAVAGKGSSSLSTGPSGYTEQGDLISTSPGVACTYATVNSGNTTSTVTWGSSFTGSWTLFIYEVALYSAPAVSPRSFGIICG